jgi:hypothetical protein
MQNRSPAQYPHTRRNPLQISRSSYVSQPRGITCLPGIVAATVAVVVRECRGSGAAPVPAYVVRDLLRHPVPVPGMRSVVAVVALFEADDGDGVLAALPGLSDGVRADAWEALRRRLCVVLGDEQRQGSSKQAWSERIRARALLALAVGPPDVARRVGTYVYLHPPATDVERVLASRTREWRQALTEATLRSEAAETEVGLFGPLWWDVWRRLRHLERAGALHPHGTSPDYLVLMVRGLLFSDSIADAVGADPDLTEQSIWSLFEPAPAVQKALLGSERYWNPANTWRVALVRLALAGVLDRQRLADAAAAAADDVRLGRNHRSWYRRMVQLLDDPHLLPQEAGHGPPPPGNQLRRLS